MYLFIIGLLLSYFFSILILPSNEGDEPSISPTIYPLFYEGMIFIPISKTKALHIHHRLIYLLIGIIGVFFNFPKIIIGFCAGLFIQGITYEDSFNFIEKNPYNKE